MLHLGLIWYHSEPSDIPYSLNQLSCQGLFLLFLTARRLYNVHRKVASITN